MKREIPSASQQLPNGVMLNAYPDSLGDRLEDAVALLERPELRDAFSLFYVLPTFFNSDLDRGFSIIDYDMNEALVSQRDLDRLQALGITLKLDLVLNHLSVRSPQFQDLLRNGEASAYKDFFIDWNDFWGEHGELNDDGTVMPHREHLEKLFMRKPDLPILRVCFPDGSFKAYWNTFYQKIELSQLAPQDLVQIDGLRPDHATSIVDTVNQMIAENAKLEEIDLGDLSQHKKKILAILCQKSEHLGQMDLNAQSELVWKFYDDTLKKLSGYGAKIIRLDAFAYLHKEPGQPNFFNRPGTWSYLERLRSMAEKYGLIVFPEIHAEYGAGVHEEISREGYPIYDFFFPGLVIDAIDRGTGAALRRWIHDIQSQGMQTINMLGCHDGLPVLDLKGKQVDGKPYRMGLLDDAEIEATIDRIVERGGRLKNLFGPDGKKIAYYQVNATFYSALGEDDDSLRLARAIQMFMPGIPQVWYLDLFAGVNDYEAADNGGTAGHKEINRTNLSRADIEERLAWPVVRDQIALIRLRNTSPAFRGEVEVLDGAPHEWRIRWHHPEETLTLNADLCDRGFEIVSDRSGREEVVMAFGQAGRVQPSGVSEVGRRPAR
jgi:sucrose phosphorylase